MFRCSKCGNEDKKYFGILNNSYYCRLCVSFNGVSAKKRKIELKEQVDVFLNYKLSKKQKDISDQIVEAFKEEKDCLIYAVCGAGKTELVYQTMAYALNNGLQVGFTIPRKDVVIELEERIASAFPNCNVISVYGGKTDVLEGDIIVLTTHQLYRYNNYFDLLIIDETDAFPYVNNEVLNYFFKQAIKGNYIMMSATPLESSIKEIKQNNGAYFELMVRYHGHPLIVPKNVIFPFFKEIWVLYKIKEYKRLNKKCFIFCPTIDEVEDLYKKIKGYERNIEFVHSKRKEREKIIEDFKKGKYNFLITTSILERGVTVKDLQVIVYNAHNQIYSSSALIQIAGRVGRKIDSFNGDVFFLCDYISNEMSNAILKIKEANENVGNL